MLVATGRRDTTTSTVVVSPGGGCLLVDPAWEVDELEALADDLDDLGLRPAAGLSTHAHFDHLLWHHRFGDVPRWASAETARRAAAGQDAILDELGPWRVDLQALVGRVRAVEPGADGSAAILPWPGPRVELLVHDGHIPGHTAAWLPEQRILLAGDMLSDVEPPLPEDGPDPVAAYARGLDALEPLVRRAAWVVPGHGHPGQDAAARLAHDRRFVEALAAGRTPDDPCVTVG
ncbi:MBL fold metallo-hydrolase [Frondihabitans peucedani]|uniref:MBL fold metallo-hydrolase n=1 Tax=Frondihabitans peucedani TaxID=598626 RepID=A0ABP8E0T4_9MICO